MIPADHWRDNGDGTAWWVRSTLGGSIECTGLDRPCDCCGGDGRVPGITYGTPGTLACADCSGAGRHTFTVEVETFTVFDASDGERAIRYELRTYRVSVVPGIVLPVRSGHPDEPMWTAGERLIHMMGDTPYIIIARGGGWGAANVEERIALPPAAAPGMWAVLLAVHQ